MEEISEWFWNERVWLPPNVTWQKLETLAEQRENYSNFSYLWYPLPAALVLLVIRAAMVQVAFRPLGIAMGLRATPHRKPPTNEVLEAGYRQSKTLDQKRLTVFAKELGLSERQVERWWRMRKALTRPTTLEKFSETGWRCFYYSALFGYGLTVLWTKPWLWDIRHCWYDYPNHTVEGDVWGYYMLELSLYWSLTLSQFVDVKRKDFWEMFVHHLTTICLLCFSWTCNLTRVGTLVMVIHDIADIFLEAAKMCKYTNYQKTCDVLFASFAVTWIVTRLGVYPTWILYSTTIEAPQIVEMFPAYYIFNGLLSILLVLHVVWTYFILKIVYKAMYSGKTEKDTRSDSSDETVSSSPESSPNHSPSHQFGATAPHENGVIGSDGGAPKLASQAAEASTPDSLRQRPAAPTTTAD